MKNRNINFHQTFYPNFDYIGKILEISDISEGLSIDDISQRTGIPTGVSSGKVLPHIKYAEYMNLINVVISDGLYEISKTDFGNIVYNEDSYFSESISRLLCHMFLTSPAIGAGLWSFIYRSLQFRYGEVVKKEVIESDIEEFFGKSTKLSAFNSSYINANSFGNLNLLGIDEGAIRFLEFSYEDEYFYAVLYSLFVELTNKDANRTEFTSVELFNDIKWNYSVNWSEKRAMEFLEESSDKGWITLNRQLSPTTIILRKSTKELLEKIYSELI
jgi:hypothetical protein